MKQQVALDFFLNSHHYLSVRFQHRNTHARNTYSLHNHSCLQHNSKKIQVQFRKIVLTYIFQHRNTLERYTKLNSLLPFSESQYLKIETPRQENKEIENCFNLAFRLSHRNRKAEHNNKAISTPCESSTLSTILWKSRIWILKRMMYSGYDTTLQVGKSVDKNFSSPGTYLSLHCNGHHIQS